MNDWQKGFPIEQLRELAAPFKARHKPLVFGAFGLTKERDIAEALAAHRVIWTGSPPQAVAIFSRLKHGSTQQDFAQREIPLGAGHVFIRAFAALSAEAGAKVLRALSGRAAAPCWLEVFEEDEIARAALQEAGGFAYVATKISAGSEIKGMYFSGAPPLAPIGAADEATLKIVERDFLSPADHAAIKSELKAFDSLWAQHYSSYNKRQSWEAFALQGYDDDPGFIIKPAEMAKGWKEENRERLAAPLRPTKAAGNFLNTLAAIRRLAAPKQCDRIRFMRLRAKGGALGRHADITDREAGTADGMICRMHIPIETSTAVLFSGWNARGEKIDTSFPERALCYLDQRKPHAVTNADPELARVHLVVDCIASETLRARLA